MTRRCGRAAASFRRATEPCKYANQLRNFLLQLTVHDPFTICKPRLGFGGRSRQREVL